MTRICHKIWWSHTKIRCEKILVAEQIAKEDNQGFEDF
jgi:hypothetical protein